MGYIQGLGGGKKHALENSNFREKMLCWLMSLKRLNSNQFHKHLLSTYWPWGHRDKLFSLRRAHSNFPAPLLSADSLIYIGCIC